MKTRRRKLVGTSYSKISAKRQSEIDAKENIKQDHKNTNFYAKEQR